MKNWLIARLKEHSTYQGIFQFAGGLLALWFIFRYPAYAVQVVTAVLMVTGASNIAKNDTPKPPPPPDA